MISNEDIFSIGITQKSYGIKGEIIILFNDSKYADLNTDYYYLRIEGLPVPFFIEDFIYTTEVSARVKFEDLDDELKVSTYSNLEVLVDRSLVDNITHETNTDNWFQFIEYTIIDSEDEIIGIIKEVDDSTLNVLFLVQSDNDEILIPATEDFIIQVDDIKKVIKMDLPEGLLKE